MEDLKGTSTGPGSGPVDASIRDTVAMPPSPSELNRRNGRIAGILFIAGGIAGTPAIALQDPALPFSFYLLTAVAILSGVACLMVPWERISRCWMHAVGVAASLEVFAITVVVDPVFCWYYALVAVWAAYVFSSRKEVALQVGLAVVLMFTAAAFESWNMVVYMLVAVPALVTATALVWTLREQLEKGQAGYRLLSRQDPLTGVGNYRELRDALSIAVARHEAAQKRFALILFDLNDFKSVNDDHGHLEGDRVLREVGLVLTETARKLDTVARHGGDEFSVVAPETSEGEAGELASRLEQAVGRLTVGDRALSAHTGSAIYPDHGKSPDELMNHADRVLKEEKRERRALSGTGSPKALSSPR